MKDFHLGNAETSEQEDLLSTLEHLLSIEEIEVEPVLNQAADLLVKALNAEKIDVFLYNAEEEALIAFGVSDTPMGRKQKQLGLNRMPIAGGGRAVEVFLQGNVYFSGHVEQDSEELAGIKEGLGIRSVIIVPLVINQRRQGAVEANSSQNDFFSEQNVYFMQAVAHWLGLIAHRAQLTEQIEREAEQRGKRLAAEELLTILAHDLKNYLTPLRARLNLLKRRAVVEARDKDIKDLEALERTEQRFEHMITNLLDVARLRQNILVLSYQFCDLAQIVREAVQTLSSPVILTEVQAPEELEIWADAERIYQLLENLLANALEHASKGSTVLVKLEIEKQIEMSYVQITVRDYGVGVPLELREQIFQPFQSGENSKGLGLGLYLAKSIAIAHGGDLILDEKVTDGASFLVRLPVKSESS